MWGLSYILVAIVAPDISDFHPILYWMIGAIILFGLLLNRLAYDKLGHQFVGLYFFVVAVLMVYGGVASWTGVAVWNVPFENPEIFNVSMGFADLLSAALMLVIATEQ